MKTVEKENIVFIRLFPGENINEEIKKASIDHSINSAVVLSGIGQLKNINLGYFKEKGNYCEESFKRPHELLSLSGNIVKYDEEHLLHLHSVISNEQKNALGGHLIDGTVEITAEIVLLKTNIELKRRLDKKTGLKALILE